MSKPGSRRDAADGLPGNRGGVLLAPLRPAGEPVEGLLPRAQFFVPGGTPGVRAAA